MAGRATATIRLGVLGCADVARRCTLPAVVALPEFTLSAIASRDAGRAAALAGRFGGEPVCGYESLLARDDLDAVYIALPAALHGECAEAALRAGLHVLVEKPLADTEDEARRLVALARRQGLVIMENFAFVWHSQHAAVRRLLAEGAIGELRAFSGEFAFPPRDPADIRYRRDLGGGALRDAGVYPIRAARLYLGDELAVAGAVLRVDAVYGVDVAGSALLTTPQGVTAQLCFGFVHAYRCSYTLWGSTGRISVDRAYSTPDDFPPAVRLERDGHAEAKVLPPDRQFTRMLAGFAAAVRHGEVSRSADGIPHQARLVERITIVASRHLSQGTTTHLELT
jgi:NDP-hexose-3-ketoreductase